MTPGVWMVRCCRHCPEVAARIWLCDHEPGIPENKLDRPFWQGQIGLDLTPPDDVWAMVWFCEAPREEQARLSKPLNLRVDVAAGRVARSETAPVALWKRERARRISQGEFGRQIAWLKWAERNAPRHPEFSYRTPVTVADAPIPRFGRWRSI
jgi:hypothetical protein